MAKRSRYEMAISSEKAMELVCNVVRAAAPRGSRNLEDALERAANGGSLQLEVVRGWGCSADLSVRLETDEYVREGEGTAAVVWQTVRALVQVGWSSTGRTPSGAIAAITLYREVAELAAELEAHLAEFTIANRRDADPAPAALDAEPAAIFRKRSAL